MAARLVLALPPCTLCGRDAVVGDALLTWAPAGRADLCESCYAQHGRPPSGHRLEEAAATVGDLTSAQVATYLDAQTWVYAKTMPKWPHEYVLLRRSTDPWTHLRMVAFIRRHGEKRRWQRRWHSYYRPGDGRQYWTMRGQDHILNRAREDDDD